MRTWEPATRRLSSLVVVATTALLVLVGLGLYLLSEGAWLDAALWFLVAVILGLLVFQGLLLFLAAPAQDGGVQAMAAGGSAGGASQSTYDDESSERSLSLRCGRCGTIFDVQDIGVRPLYHTCPGCGAEGVLNEGEGMPSEPARASASASSTSAGASAAGAGAAAGTGARKRLKLRCGGCTHIFVLEDPGTRPLRHACPSCGRKGELR